MKHKSLESDECAVARSLDAIGDWWSILIIRDAMGGKRRFGEFQKSLGLAKNILTVRLRKLVAEGILRLEPASDGSAYQEYVLTEKGEGLYVVVAALWQWGENSLFAKGELKRAIIDRSTGKRLPPIEVKAADGRVLGPRDIQLTLADQAVTI